MPARALVAELRAAGRLKDWIAAGISATHHTAGRIDRNHNQVRRAICWNDQTLAAYRARGERRLKGANRVRELIGGPWADRYTLSHLVKDEDPDRFSPEVWQRTYRILPHGPLAAGYLTGQFDVISVSAAASTGIMDLRKMVWCPGMLGALAGEQNRRLALSQLPRIIDHFEPIGPLAEHVAIENGMEMSHRPLIFPTSDDQQAGLVGGGAVDSGQMAVILGNSAVVNSSSQRCPTSVAMRAGARSTSCGSIGGRIYGCGATTTARSFWIASSVPKPIGKRWNSAAENSLRERVKRRCCHSFNRNHRWESPARCNRPGPAKNRTTAGSDFARRWRRWRS